MTTVARILIVDDSELVKDRLQELLAEKDGIKVIGTAGDTQQGISEIERLKPDLVILDIAMPGGGGMPVLKHIKATQSDCVVIVLTSYPYPQYRQAYLTAGAEYFFDKTSELGRLIVVLADLNQQRTMHTPTNGHRGNGIGLGSPKGGVS